MPSTYAGTHFTFEKQLEQLKARGLTVADEDAAISQLSQLGYYRLSAYWYPMRESGAIQDPASGTLAWEVKNNFVADASFDDAAALYRFDKRLRALVMDAVEAIEVAMRVNIAYELGKHSPFAQEESDLLDGNFTFRETTGELPNQTTRPSRHDEWLAKLESQVSKSKEEFVTHYKKKYGMPLPIWVAIEVWDFGLLSHFFSGMKFKDQEVFASRFDVPNPGLARSWLRTINYVRNMAAHHSRLWNRRMVEMPKLPKAGQFGERWDVLSGLDNAKPYATLCIIAHLISVVCPGSRWPRELADHLASFPDPVCSKIKISAIGCDAGWEQHPFWH